jgi:hypothetical protein
VAANAVIKCGAEGGVGKGEWKQSTIAVVDEGPDGSRDGGDEGSPDVRQMNQRKSEAGDEDRPDGLVFWKKNEQTTEEVELEKGLLN